MALKADIEKFLRGWPIFGVVAPTGTGKTWLTASALQEEWARPMRFIDGDLGSTTITSLVKQPKLVDHRPYKVKDGGRDDAMSLQRFCVEECKLAAADKNAGSIAIEGLGRLYMLMQGEMVDAVSAKNPNATVAEIASKLDGHAGQALYKAGAQLMRGVITQIDLLRRAKRTQAAKGGKGGIIIVTLTTRTSQVNAGGSMVEVVSPELSKNVTAALMASCDGFFDLTRTGATTRLLCERTEQNPFRKARNPSTAARISGLSNPTFGQIVEAFVEGETEMDQAVAEMMAKAQ